MSKLEVRVKGESQNDDGESYIPLLAHPPAIEVTAIDPCVREIAIQSTEPRVSLLPSVQTGNVWSFPIIVRDPGTQFLEGEFLVNGNEVVPFRLETRIPVQVVPSDRIGKENDVKLTPRVRYREEAEPFVSVSDVAERLEKRTDENILWVQGGLASGKSVFLAALKHELKHRGWRIVDITADLYYLRSDCPLAEMRGGIQNRVTKDCEEDFPDGPPSVDFAEQERQGGGPAMFKDEFNKAVTTRVAFIFDECDVYVSNHGDRIYDVVQALKDVMNDVCWKSSAYRRVVLIIADHRAASNRVPREVIEKRDFRLACAEVLPRFALSDVKAMIEQLPIPASIRENLADRVWIWTRGHPILVNALLYEYLDRWRLSKGQNTSPIDSMVCSSPVRRAIEHMVETADKPLSNDRDPATVVRLEPRERALLDRVAREPWYTPSADDDIEILSLLEQKGLIAARRNRKGEMTYSVDIPLLRYYLRGGKALS